MTLADHTKQTGRQSKLIGGGMALLLHALLLILFLSANLHPEYPEPQDQGVLVEYLPEPQPEIPKVIPDYEPHSPEPDPISEIRLVQQATHTEIVPSEARTQVATLGETGDVELSEPPPPLSINQRALFRSRDTGDSLAEQSSRVANTAIKPGHPNGNTQSGNPDGKPFADLEGRSVVGSLPLPEYKARNKGGTVVVRIMVAPDGNVTRAIIQGEHTTTSEKILRDAAIEAALKAKFNNVSSQTFLPQVGTITYVFTLM